MGSSDDEGGEKIDWSDFDQDLLSCTLSRLVIGDYLTFQSVCKSWNSVTLTSYHLSMSHDTDCYQTPHLMYLNMKTSLFDFHDPTRNTNHSLDFPKLLDDGDGEVDIYYARCGWLLVGKGRKSYFFFNPSTKVKIDLPNIPAPHFLFEWMCFYGSPTSSNCKIVGIISLFLDHIMIGTLRLGENSWSIKSRVKNNQEFLISSCSPVACNGNFYLLGGDGNVGKLSVSDEGNLGYWDVIGKEHTELFEKFRDRFLLESDGDLMCVATLYGGREVCVMKLDHQMVWQKVDNLNGKALYVSHRTSLSKKATAPGTDNKVYFSRFYDHKGLFYCLATKEWRNFPHNFLSKNYYNTSEIIRCIWTELPSDTDS